MRLHRILGWVLLVFAGIVTLILYLSLGAIEQSALDTATSSVRFGEFVIEMPVGFRPENPQSSEGWEIVDYRKPGVGSLRLATIEADPAAFERLSCRYFNLDSFPREPVLYKQHGRRSFARPLLLLEGGIYVMQRHRGHVTHTCMFGYGRHLYWMAYSTRHTISTYAQVFHRVILSLSHDGMVIPGDAVSEALQTVCRDGWFLFC